MRKILLIIVCLLIIARSNGQRDPKIVKVQVADTSRKKPVFWKTFDANSPKNTNGQENLRNMKFDRVTYATTYLKASGIMANNDAIALVTKLNPQLADSINYGTMLQLPELGKLTGEKEREMNRDLKEMNRYSKEDCMEFMELATRFDSTYLLLKETKLRSDTAGTYKEFGTTIDYLNKYVSTAKKEKLSKGRYQLLTKNLTTVLKVFDKCIKERSVKRTDVYILKSCARNMAPEGSYLQVSGKGDFSFIRQHKFRVAAVPGITKEVDEDYNDPPETVDNVNKTCYIYAITTDKDGKELEDMQHHFFYAFLTSGDALWEYYQNNNSAYTEQNEDVSFSTVNMAVAEYVFKFREKNTGNIYWRCYTQDDFKIYDKNGDRLNKDEVRIIFNPGANNCEFWKL